MTLQPLRGLLPKTPPIISSGYAPGDGQITCSSVHPFSTETVTPFPRQVSHDLAMGLPSVRRHLPRSLAWEDRAAEKFRSSHLKGWGWWRHIFEASQIPVKRCDLCSRSGCAKKNSVLSANVLPNLGIKLVVWCFLGGWLLEPSLLQHWLKPWTILDWPICVPPLW